MEDIRVVGPYHGPRYEQVLTEKSLAFVAGLERRVRDARRELLVRRERRLVDLEAGLLPEFPDETEGLRESVWRVAPEAPGLVDRRVEITGPVERKMMINALNSGAERLHGRLRGLALADLGERGRGPGEPASTPCGATHRLREPGREELPAQRADRHAAGPAPRLAPGREARPGRRRAGLGQPVRLRAVLLPQRRRSCCAAAAARTSTCRSWRATSRRGCGTTSSTTPRTTLGIPRGTIRATVLIETILAAFEMDEILYELREHAAGLNAGRWDYIFSIIKKFRPTARPSCPTARR